MKDSFSICFVGHVDHGKSSLIGRLLADTGSLPKGKLEQFQQLSEEQGVPFRYADLLDVLETERSQGITLDTARIFFKTSRRDYQIIDAPGHFGLLRNMVTGASRADAGFLVIDAKEGIKENSYRHGRILRFLGLSHIVVLVNKMDLVDYSEQVFNEMKSEIQKNFQLPNLIFIPVSAQEGLNVASRSEKISWYKGPCLLEILDGFNSALQDSQDKIRISVQGVFQNHVLGVLLSGKLRKSENLAVNSQFECDILEIADIAESLTHLQGPGPVALKLRSAKPLKRGDVIHDKNLSLVSASKITSQVLWLSKEPLSVGNPVTVKIGTRSEAAQVLKIAMKTAADGSALTDNETLSHGEIAEVTLQMNDNITYDLFGPKEWNKFVIVHNGFVAGGGSLT